MKMNQLVINGAKKRIERKLEIIEHIEIYRAIKKMTDNLLDQHEEIIETLISIDILPVESVSQFKKNTSWLSEYKKTIQSNLEDMYKRDNLGRSEDGWIHFSRVLKRVFSKKSKELWLNINLLENKLYIISEFELTIDAYFNDKAHIEQLKKKYMYDVLTYEDMNLIDGHEEYVTLIKGQLQEDLTVLNEIDSKVEELELDLLARNEDVHKMIIALGWHWVNYNDGSGYLQSPEGEHYFRYDLTSGEYCEMDRKHYKSYHGKDFKTMAELWVACDVIDSFKTK